jgi:hypothetical protein
VLKTFSIGMLEFLDLRQEIKGGGLEDRIRQTNSPNLMDRESSTRADFLIGDRCLIGEEKRICLLLVNRVHWLSSSPCETPFAS